MLSCILFRPFYPHNQLARHSKGNCMLIDKLWKASHKKCPGGIPVLSLHPACRIRCTSKAGWQCSKHIVPELTNTLCLLVFRMCMWHLGLWCLLQELYSWICGLKEFLMIFPSCWPNFLWCLNSSDILETMYRSLNFVHLWTKLKDLWYLPINKTLCM